MTSSALALLISGAVVAFVGAALVISVSARLRSEIQSLFRAFDRTERSLVPIVVELRSDRERLAERYQRLIDGGTENDSPRQ